MATIVKRVLTGSTANATTYASGSFTPTVGDLLVGIVHATGSADIATTLTSSANAITFTALPTLVQTLSGNVSVVFVADQLVGASPASMTVTYGLTTAATGAFIEVDAVTGMSRAGMSAVRQSAFNVNLAANVAWAATFLNAVLTSNPVLGFVGHAGGATVTPPAGWTELDQPTDQVTPTVGFEVAEADSGQTALSYTWTSSLGSPANNTRANIGAVEFDTSAVTYPNPTPIDALAGWRRGRRRN